MPRDTPIESRAWHSKIFHASLNENDPVFSDEMRFSHSRSRQLVPGQWPRLAHFRITHVTNSVTSLKNEDMLIYSYSFYITRFKVA